MALYSAMSGEPKRVDVIRRGECRVFYEAKTVLFSPVILHHVPDDLVLFISHYNPDVRYSRGEQAVNLVIENCPPAAVKSDQTFRMVSTNGVDSCPTSRCQNECLQNVLLTVRFACPCTLSGNVGCRKNLRVK